MALVYIIVGFVLLGAIDLIWEKLCRDCERDGVINLHGQE